jgi:NitT/TauT family transport system permease protein
MVPVRLVDFGRVSFLDVCVAILASVYRLLIAYFLSLFVALPLALLAVSHPRLEKLLLPIFDVFQSVPALAFFPLIVLVFIKLNFYEAAAVFVIFMAMVWNMIFSMVGGLKTVPGDIKSAAQIFQAKGLNKLRFVTLPAIFPYIVMGSLLAWGQGWTIIIVAEVLHTYIPNGNPRDDLNGLGSLLVNASSKGDNLLFVVALVAMIIIISLMNFFVWQKFLHISERYKFD